MPDVRDIQEICGRLDRGEIDRDQFFEQLTRAVADLIGCTRAGVWIFLDTAEGRALRCMAMYDRRVDRIVGASDMVVTPWRRQASMTSSASKDRSSTTGRPCRCWISTL